MKFLASVGHIMLHYVEVLHQRAIWVAGGSFYHILGILWAPQTPHFSVR